MVLRTLVPHIHDETPPHLPLPKSNFMKACDIVQIYPKSMVSSHLWHYNIIFCTLQMNLPILTTSFLSPTKLHGYGKKGHSLYLYHEFLSLKYKLFKHPFKTFISFQWFLLQWFFVILWYIYLFLFLFLLLFLKNNCQKWKIILKICAKLSQLPITYTLSFIIIFTIWS